MGSGKGTSRRGTACSQHAGRGCTSPYCLARCRARSAQYKQPAPLGSQTRARGAGPQSHPLAGTRSTAEKKGAVHAVQAVPRDAEVIAGHSSAPLPALQRRLSQAPLRAGRPHEAQAGRRAGPHRQHDFHVVAPPQAGLGQARHHVSQAAHLHAAGGARSRGRRHGFTQQSAASVDAPACQPRVAHAPQGCFSSACHAERTRPARAPRGTHRQRRQARPPPTLAWGAISAVTCTTCSERGSRAPPGGPDAVGGASGRGAVRGGRSQNDPSSGLGHCTGAGAAQAAARQGRGLAEARQCCERCWAGGHKPIGPPFRCRGLCFKGYT